MQAGVNTGTQNIQLLEYKIFKYLTKSTASSAS